MKHSHHHDKQVALPELTRQLRQKARKVTGPRQAILNILRQHPHPLTNKEIFSRLPKGECDLATIYRSLHLLENMAMVQRYDFGDGVARYELVAAGAAGHHHHLICTGCAEVVEIEDCFPHKLEKQIADRNGFKAVTHKLEFFGLCPECQ